MPKVKAKPRKANASTSSNKIGVVYDERMTSHQDPVDPKHPEQPARISRIFEELTEQGLLNDDSVTRVPVNPATTKDLLTVHTNDWVATCIECASPSSSAFASSSSSSSSSTATDSSEDSDANAVVTTPPSLAELIFMSQRFDSVFMNQASIDCALLSAGGTIEVTKKVVQGECRNGVAIVRPPGHHAEAHCAKGFCFFNNVAIACAVATRSLGVKRVLVVDWDVHHGNGTQHMFEGDSSVLFFSVHRHDAGQFYPNSVDGAPFMVGLGAGKGFNANVAWNGSGSSSSGGGPGGFGDADYLYAWEKLLIPLAAQFKPELTIISAGFDAAKGDPLGGCSITPQGYAHLTKQVMEVSPEGKVVMVLEGGYNLTSISSSFAECVKVLKSPTETSKTAAFNKAINGNSSNSKNPTPPSPSPAAAASDAAEAADMFLPPAYGGPLLPSAAARRAVRKTSLHLAKHWELPLGGTAVTRKKRPSVDTSSTLSGSGGGGSSGDGSSSSNRETMTTSTATSTTARYATKPVLLKAGVVGRAWALCFNGQKFGGRLDRFGSSGAPWTQISSFKGSCFADHPGGGGGGGGCGYGKGANFDYVEDDEDSVASEEAGDITSSSSSSSIDCSGSSGSEGEMDGSTSDSGSREENSSHDDDDNDNGEGSKDQGGGFSFNFSLPPGVELVKSENSFTPFDGNVSAYGDGGSDNDEGGGGGEEEEEEEDEEKYWEEYFKDVQEDAQKGGTKKKKKKKKKSLEVVEGIAGDGDDDDKAGCLAPVVSSATKKRTLPSAEKPSSKKNKTPKISKKH